MGFRIFIAYSQDDYFDSGIRIRNYLSQRFPDSYVYIDQVKTKGRKWRPINERELRISNLVILIITPATIESEEVKREIKIALDENKIILPCKDDNLGLEWDELPLKIGEIDGLEFESEDTLKRRLYKTIKKIRKEIAEKTILSKSERKSEEITIQTDQKSYIKGDTIKIFGKVKERLSGLPVSSQLISSNGNLVAIQQFDVKSNNTFKSQIKAGGPLWKSYGTFTIKVLYGTASRTSQVTFDYIKLGVEEELKIIKILPGSSSPSKKRYLDPEILTIKTGEKVKWINDDSAAHTITSGTPAEGPDGVFDSSMFMAGNSFEIKFQEKGTYSYFCLVHPWKVGTINVL